MNSTDTLPMGVLALLSDFGVSDWYVASMKGQILSVDPTLNIIDVSHEVPPGDVEGAAFILSQCWKDFPDGTVFCCVVDPGVGTARSPVAVRETDSSKIFVGPDNGLISYVMHFAERHDAKDRVLGFQARRIVNNLFFRESASHTFHGRDVFAPTAARLASGWAFDKIGPFQPRLHSTRWKSARINGAAAEATVLHVDRFGNLITNLRRSEINAIVARLHEVRAIKMVYNEIYECAIPLVKTFNQVADQSPLAFIGSGDLLEIGINSGSAAADFEIVPGDVLRLLFEPRSDLLQAAARKLD